MIHILVGQNMRQQAETRSAPFNRARGQRTERIDAIRQISIIDQTYYRWRKQYGGMGPDQLKELKRLRRDISDLTLRRRDDNL